VSGAGAAPGRGGEAGRAPRAPVAGPRFPAPARRAGTEADAAP
jgi:hypothetical protein